MKSTLIGLICATLPVVLSADEQSKGEQFTLGESQWIEVIDSGRHSDTCRTSPGDTLIVLSRENDTVLALVDAIYGGGTRCDDGSKVLVSYKWLESQREKYQAYRQESDAKSALVNRLQRMAGE